MPSTSIALILKLAGGGGGEGLEPEEGLLQLRKNMLASKQAMV